MMIQCLGWLNFQIWLKILTAVILSSFVISLSFWNDRTTKERKKGNGLTSFGWHFFRSMIILSSQNDVQMTKTRVKWRIFWIKAIPLIHKFTNFSSHYVISNQFIIVFIIIPFIPMSFHSFQCHSIYSDVIPFVPMSFHSFWCHSTHSNLISSFRCHSIHSAIIS